MNIEYTHEKILLLTKANLVAHQVFKRPHMVNLTIGTTEQEKEEFLIAFEDFFNKFKKRNK